MTAAVESAALSPPCFCFRSVPKILACSAALLLSGCALLADDHKDLEKRCRAEARTIVHSDELWKEHSEGSNQNYLARKSEFPETGRAVPEYVPGFEERFGRQLEANRSINGDEVIRNDIYILKDGKIVAQLVDFVLPAGGFGGGAVINCTGLFPELYARTSRPSGE